jgi:hypothetical protein
MGGQASGEKERNPAESGKQTEAGITLCGARCAYRE